MLKKKLSQVDLNHLMQLLNSGNSVATEARARELSKSHPKTMIVWKILGVAIAGQGRMAEAIMPMQKAIQLDPKNGVAHRNLAKAFKILGQINNAETHFRKAAALNPEDAQSYTEIAKILNSQNKHKEAEKLCRKAIGIKFGMGEVHNQLGSALLAQQQFSAAEDSLRQAIMFSPNLDDAHNNLGMTLTHQGRYTEADQCYRLAINCNPNYANAYCNLGDNFANQGQWEESEAAYRKAIDIDPEHELALVNLITIILHAPGRKKEAQIMLEQALELNLQSAALLNILGNAHKDLGDIEAALECFQKAFTTNPEMMSAYSNFLFISGYYTKASQEQSLQAAKEYGRHASARAKNKYKKWQCQLPIDASTSKIRVGFVSGDLRKHAVTFFLEGLLRNLDKNRFELIAYPTQPHEDEISELIKPHFIKWQSIFGKNDQEAAEIIHQDAPYILFDLSGHTAHNRLPMFAYKPAPIQATWLGYPATTGLPEMDYIMADPYLITADDEHFFSEKVWRLPEITWCFDPLQEQIPVTELPALKNNYITFGSFNSLTKINAHVIKVWAEILHAIPTAKLYLQAIQLNEAYVMQQTYNEFIAAGVNPNQLTLEVGGTRENYFHSFNKVDIALDPFPCAGGTTSADTLWMGVPILTIKKQGHFMRISETIMHNVDLAHWVAEDTQDYVKKAIAFSSDIPTLAKLRGNLRQQVMGSTLIDIARYTQHFETALTKMVSLYNISD